MAATWELILNHTYAGTPGVVFDLSPGRGAHGTAINLPDSDFLTDGASRGSGAVDFRSGGRISVRPTQAWDRLGGVRGEVTCVFEDISGSVISTPDRLSSIPTQNIWAAGSARRRFNRST